MLKPASHTAGTAPQAKDKPAAGGAGASPGAQGKQSSRGGSSKAAAAAAAAAARPGGSGGGGSKKQQRPRGKAAGLPEGKRPGDIEGDGVWNFTGGGRESPGHETVRVGGGQRGREQGQPSCLGAS